MKSFQMSRTMKLASVWVVWGFYVIGVLGWALFTVLNAFGMEEHAASWVQAVGSLVGIAIAIWVPARQWQMVLKEKREDAMREDHQLALMGLKMCLEVEELLKELKKRNSGDRNEWHDKEYFRARIEALHDRFGTLIGVERNTTWWNLFLDAKRMLLELDAVIRLHGVDAGVLGVLSKQYQTSWEREIKSARANLQEFEDQHREVLHKDFWGGSLKSK